MIGRTLLHYRILEKLGRGGMGEVYSAFDSRLSRRVALKILPPELAGDPDLETRFEREARAVAALNHPNIVTVYSVEKAGDTHFITMELVEGKTLAAAIPTHGFPLERFFAFSIPLADALSSAHQHGITHRDLKPSNVMMDAEGRVKVLDFGLAKIQAQAVGSISTEASTEWRTAAGRIVGTVSYMSPEQAEGRAVDHRTDVFALGIAFYEMLTGRHPYPGETPAAKLSAILKDAPRPLTEVNPAVPRELARVVKRCLAKDPARRYQSCLDLRNELEEIREELEAPSSEGLAAPTPPRPAGTLASWRAALLAGAILGVAVGVLGAIALRRAPARDAVTRFSVAPPRGGTFDAAPGAPQPAVSPDGRHLLFGASGEDSNYSIWVRSLDSVMARALAGTQRASNPFWSPDSRHIGFFADGQLKKTDLSGGPPQALAESDGGGGSWSREGVILFGRSDGLYRVPSQGGEPTRVTQLDASRRELAHRHPQFLPDGRRFLYLVIAEEPENQGVYVGSLDSTDRKRISSEPSRASYVPPGQLLFVRQNTLLAQPFDATQMEPTGDPVPIADRVMSTPTTRDAPFSVSANVLAFRQGGWSFTTQLTWIDREGRELGAVGAAGLNVEPSLSPDETRIALTRFDPTTNMDIWTIDLARNVAERFTAEPGFEFEPVWSPDGESIVFVSSRRGRFDLYRKAANGAGTMQLLPGSPPAGFAQDWSRDGRFVLLGATRDIWVVPVGGDQQPFRFLETKSTEVQPRLSPDGRWIAYSSDESGAREVYVQEFRESGRRWRVSTHGGLDPRWRRDGRELFYLEPGPPTGASQSEDATLMAIGVGSGAAIQPGSPQPLFRVRVPALFVSEYWTYAVAAQGQRFLFAKVVDVEPSLVTVVLNWRETLLP